MFMQKKRNIEVENVWKVMGKTMETRSGLLMHNKS